MAGRGPAPKDPAERRRRNVDPIQRTKLGEPPKRPPALRIRATCRPETREWWKKWATSPNAGQFTPVMWERLQMLALLVDGFFETPTATTFAEIRRAESELGAMPADRARLRWDMPDEVGAAERRPEAEGEVSKFDERRAAALRMVKGAG